MWIAKNSLTGYEYSQKFSSIYECSSYIAKELFIVEYLCQRIKLLEDRYEDDNKYAEWRKTHYKDCSGVSAEIIARISFAMEGFMSDLQSDKKPEIISDIYSSNHIIRCYNVEQHRFATDFDF